MTEERAADLEVLQMRGVLDPKRFYKKNASDTAPKYFQVMTVQENWISVNGRVGFLPISVEF